MIFVDFYSTHYKVYIHITHIITQWWTKAPFDINHFISYSNRQTPRLYQGWADCCEGDCNLDIIRLLQPSQTIQYCNQSVLEIVPDLNIFVWTIISVDPISRKCPDTVLFYYVLPICITRRGLRFYNFGLLPYLRLRDSNLNRWVYCIVTTKIWYQGLCCFVWFLIILFDSLYSFTLN